MDVSHWYAKVVKTLMQFFIIYSKVNQTHAFFFDQILYLAVVVAFVSSAKNQHSLGSHTLKCIPAGVHIGGFRVIDEFHATHGSHIFQTMRDTLEVAQRLSDILLADEPTSDLDDENTKSVLEILRRCADEGMAVMLVTHEKEAAAYADQACRMNNGILTSL